MTRRGIACLLAGVLPCLGFDVGFDFRASAGYATDPPYSVFAGSVSYPTTATVNGQQVTFGWEMIGAGFLARDRDNSGDARLAGINCQANNGTVSVFRVDLPATGTYSIGIAAGDGNGYSQSNHVVVSSGAASLLSLNTATAANFGDAAGAVWGVAAWAGSNVSVQRFFGSTVLRLTVGGTDSAYSCVAHFRISSVQVVNSQAGHWSFFVQ